MLHDLRSRNIYYLNVDTAHATQPFRFEIPRGTFDPDDLTQTSFQGSALFASDRQDLDIREIHLVEDPKNFTIVVLLAHVDEEPQDHRFIAGLGAPTGRIHAAGYRADGDGQREEWAGTCSDPECSDWISYDVEIAFDPGSPGWVNLSFSRTDIDAPMEGDRLNVVFAQMTGPREPFPFLGAGIGPAGISAEWRAIGWSGVAPPYYSQLDTQP